MKVVCTQENLNQGLQIVSGIASKSVNLPILNNVYIKAQEGAIQLSTTNLEVGVHCTVRGKIENEGEITVQSRLLLEYISFLPKENVSLEVGGQNNDELHIQAQNHSTKIKGMPASDFPLIPGVDKKNPVVCKTADLRQALTQVVFAVSANETRPELNGVFFQLSGDMLTLAGTDSYRLAEKKLSVKNQSKQEYAAIVPARTLQELLRILSTLKDPSQMEDVEQVNIFFTENQILFSIGGIDMVSRLLEGKYPGYSEIIPQKFNTTVTVNSQELLKAIKGASLFSRSGVYDVNLEFNPSEHSVVVNSTNTQLGENTTKVHSGVVGEKNTLSVNYRFLLDGLQNIDSEDVQIQILTPTSPCMITPKGKEGYLYIVMPIK